MLSKRAKRPKVSAPSGSKEMLPEKEPTEKKICLSLPKIDTSKIRLDLPKIEAETVCFDLPQVETQRICFDVPKITPKGCSCPPPELRCPTRDGKKPNITTRLVMPTSDIASSIGGPLSIDSIDIGDVTIPGVVLKDFSGDFTYDSCTAKKIELAITLSINTSFSGHIDLGCLGDHDVGGEVNYASYTEAQSLPDMVFDSGKFSFRSPKTGFGPFSMTAQPIRKTTIDQVTAQDIEMKCTSMPIDNPLGVNLGISLPMPNPMGPNNIVTDETSISEMDSTGIKSPEASMTNVKAFNIDIPSLTTPGFVIQSSQALPTVTIQKSTYGSGVTRTGDGDKAYLDLSLNFDITKVVITIGGLEFKNLRGTVTASSAVGQKLDLNLKLKGIKIKGLNLCGMKIPEIEVCM